MVVQHNLTAMNANRYLGINNSKLSKSLEKLSSGYAINRAGDNAAGLAVSEKMRSQIAGMTQGVKNAQDGISMVQTFEGALTETDSILQRMKTLADQAANGTYQDDVDRDAIQLEFDQLNDELNQIADTDFNGVVVLNGGQMADGTVAVDGKFDYSLGRTTTVVANEATDISGGAQKDKIVDQSFYNKEKADAVWEALGVDVNDVQDLKVTFMYDGERWMAQTVTNTKDEVIKGANAANLEARTVDRKNADGKGGFEVIAGKDPYTGENIIVTNAIFDENKSSGKGEDGTDPVKRGDTITISFKNTAASTYAPKNIGLDEDKTTGSAFDITSTNDAVTVNDLKKGDGLIKFTLDNGITDAAMDKEIGYALEILDNASFDISYSDGVATIGTTVTVDNTKLSADAKAVAAKLTIDANGTIEFERAGGDKVTIATLTVGNIEADNPEQDAKIKTVTGGSGATYTKNDTNDAAVLAAITGVADGGDDKLATDGAGDDITIKCATADATNGTATTFDIYQGTTKLNTTALSLGDFRNLGFTLSSTDAKGVGAGDTVATIAFVPDQSAKVGPKPGADATSIKFGAHVASFNVVDTKDLTVHAVKTPDVATMASQVAKEGVSVSNAYKNGKAPLTYTDNITLQTGARSKDAVNFTFKYTSGGMGNLKANMNCSAREDGLNTASLSLKTAESANYAIDQIDNAINKVSMVRATFGAVQNRLEHKIDNMNVSIENLTSAESQIRDTDMPTEMMNFTKQQILAQASQSMLAQANQLPQSVLSLLQ